MPENMELLDLNIWNSLYLKMKNLLVIKSFKKYYSIMNGPINKFSKLSKLIIANRYIIVLSNRDTCGIDNDLFIKLFSCYSDKNGYFLLLLMRIIFYHFFY
jgi:hypothetical protein